MKFGSRRQLDDAGTHKGFHFPWALQESDLNDVTRVLQLGSGAVVMKYSCVYQNVQSSLGSIGVLL